MDRKRKDGGGQDSGGRLGGQGGGSGGGGGRSDGGDQFSDTFPSWDTDFPPLAQSRGRGNQQRGRGGSGSSPSSSSSHPEQELSSQHPSLGGGNQQRAIGGPGSSSSPHSHTEQRSSSQDRALGVNLQRKAPGGGGGHSDPPPSESLASGGNQQRSAPGGGGRSSQGQRRHGGRYSDSPPQSQGSGRGVVEQRGRGGSGSSPSFSSHLEQGSSSQGRALGGGNQQLGIGTPGSSSSSRSYTEQGSSSQGRALGGNQQRNAPGGGGGHSDPPPSESLASGGNQQRSAPGGGGRSSQGQRRHGGWYSDSPPQSQGSGRGVVEQRNNPSRGRQQMSSQRGGGRSSGSSSPSSPYHQERGSPSHDGNKMRSPSGKSSGSPFHGYGGGSPSSGKGGGRSGTPSCYVELPGSLNSQMKYSRASPSSKLQDDNKRVPIPCPGAGGDTGIYTVALMVNHFKLIFDKPVKIFHYEFDVKCSDSDVANIKKSDLFAIKEKHFGSDSSALAYDGGKIIFSSKKLDEGSFYMEVHSNKYTIHMKLQREMDNKDLSPPYSREILQGLDVIMRQSSAMGENKLAIGRNFYSTIEPENLGLCVVASEGFRQSIKLTENGLVFCVDHSVMPFSKSVSVINFINQFLRIKIGPYTKLDRDDHEKVENALRQLLVEKTYMTQKSKVFGLTKDCAGRVKFKNRGDSSETRVADYFEEKHKLKIEYEELPCLNLRKDKDEFVPMEFCKLVEWQKYQTKSLHQFDSSKLREKAMVSPNTRMKKIEAIVDQENHCSSGHILDEFHIKVSKKMEDAEARVLHRPSLKLRDAHNGSELKFEIRDDNCQWNLQNKRVWLGKHLEKWAILHFELKSEELNQFINQLIDRCNNLGIRASYPRYYSLDINALENPNELSKMLYKIKKQIDGLQILVCPMKYQHDGYNILKYHCEIELGIMTQCCIIFRANKRSNQYFANLALKINAKLGGINFELHSDFSLEYATAPVMFIGADVNHPRSGDDKSPSIAAITGSKCWPASSYFSVVRPQEHRKEKIVDVGNMCLELIKKYREVCHSYPVRIVYFRDGVSDTQFNMVLNEELTEIKKAIDDELEHGQKPQITVVVIQKRHQTRIFHKDSNIDSNVLPGTVVDKGVIAREHFNFYLCSHNGFMGTSKPVHYYVLWDEYGFTVDELQHLIYSLCFTFARCTKPVSLVTPVYYADILAYRGRIYYEAWKIMGKGRSALTSSGPPFSIMLHDDIKHKMFFI